MKTLGRWIGRYRLLTQSAKFPVGTRVYGPAIWQDGVKTNPRSSGRIIGTTIRKYTIWLDTGEVTRLSREVVEQTWRSE